jgi:hypothetical protein
VNLSYGQLESVDEIDSLLWSACIRHVIDVENSYLRNTEVPQLINKKKSFLQETSNLTFTKIYFDNRQMSVSIVFIQNQTNKIETICSIPGQPAKSVYKQRVVFNFS